MTPGPRPAPADPHPSPDAPSLTPADAAFAETAPFADIPGLSDTGALAAPPGWLFATSSLGGSFRIYLPTIVAMRILGLLRMLAFAWLILKTEYGLQRLALQFINLLSAVARLGVPVGLERYAPAYERAGQLAAFVRRGIRVATLITAALVVALAVLSPWLTQFAFSDPSHQFSRVPSTGDLHLSAANLLQLTTACLLVTLVLTVFFSLQGLLRGLRMYRAIAMMEVLHGLTFLAFGIGGLLLAGNLRLEGSRWVKYEGAAVVLTLAYGLSLLVTSGWIGWALARHLARWPGQQQTLPDSLGPFTARLLRFSGYLTGSNVLWSIFVICGLWFINKRHGESEAGLFAASRDLMQTVQLLAMAVWPTAQNAAAHLWERGQRAAAVEQLGLVFRLSGWPLWLLSAGLVLCRPAVQMLLPAEYAGAALVLPWLLVMFMWMVHLSLPTAHAYLLEDSRSQLAAAAVGLAVHAASATWLVGRWRSIGAAQSAALGAAAAVVTLLFLIQRRLRKSKLGATLTSGGTINHPSPLPGRGQGEGGSQTNPVNPLPLGEGRVRVDPAPTPSIHPSPLPGRGPGEGGSEIIPVNPLPLGEGRVRVDLGATGGLSASAQCATPKHPSPFPGRGQGEGSSQINPVNPLPLEEGRVRVPSGDEGISWLTPRDAPLLLAPLLLAAPTAWPAGGDYLLLTAAVAALVLLAGTDVLWSRADRQTLGRYLAHSLRVILRRN